MRAENITHIVTLLVDYNKGYAFYAIKIFNDEILKKIQTGRGGGPYNSQKGDNNFSIFSNFKLLFCFSGE